MNKKRGTGSEIEVEIGSLALKGNLFLPPQETGIVIFAHGSGSSRHSPRNRFVANILNEAGLGTLLMDLLTSDEEQEDQITGHLRFDIPLLSERLILATDWLEEYAADLNLKNPKIGYFGASTGAGAALMAAPKREKQVRAIVSRGGRPDLAGEILRQVNTPTLLIVGGEDFPVIAMNQEAYNKLKTKSKKLVIVPGATHLFEEPGTLEKAAQLACEWFEIYLKKS